MVARGGQRSLRAPAIAVWIVDLDGCGVIRLTVATDRVELALMRCDSQRSTRRRHGGPLDPRISLRVVHVETRDRVPDVEEGSRVTAGDVQFAADRSGAGVVKADRQRRFRLPPVGGWVEGLDGICDSQTGQIAEARLAEPADHVDLPAHRRGHDFCPLGWSRGEGGPEPAWGFLGEGRRCQRKSQRTDGPENNVLLMHAAIIHKRVEFG